MTTLQAPAWQFLLGEWVADGSGEPGVGAGEFTFAFDLQKHILVRRNVTEFPATAQNPATRHDDLLIIYPDPDSALRAIYFDNEDHIIHYAVAIAPDQLHVTLISDRVPHTPRFRLTYTLTPPETVAVQFEIAPPDEPDAFAVYLHGSAHRKHP